MKRMAMAVVLLAALLAGSLWNARYVQRLVDGLSAPLTQAQALVEGGQWTQAEALTHNAYDAWQEQRPFVHTLLRHADTDRITEGFRVTLSHLRQQDCVEYSAANSALLTHLEVLAEIEQASLGNIF